MVMEGFKLLIKPKDIVNGLCFKRLKHIEDIFTALNHAPENASDPPASSRSYKYMVVSLKEKTTRSWKKQLL